MLKEASKQIFNLENKNSHLQKKLNELETVEKEDKASNQQIQELLDQNSNLKQKQSEMMK